MRFYKYHGTGNDFIIFKENELGPVDYKELAKQACHRHFGIGADGIMIVAPSNIADLRMIFYNADGSEATMCGNGIRCFSKFVRDQELVSNDLFTIETLAGIMKIEVTKSESLESWVKVNLGHPVYHSPEIPASQEQVEYLNRPLVIEGVSYNVSSLVMGTIHTVLFVEEIDEVVAKTLGSKIEHHPAFPFKTNVNFCKVLDHQTIEVLTWEKGVGLTLACGTGAAASAIVSSKLFNCNALVRVKVTGGELMIEQQMDGVYLMGPATLICHGSYCGYKE